MDSSSGLLYKPRGRDSPRDFVKYTMLSHTKARIDDNTKGCLDANSYVGYKLSLMIFTARSNEKRLKGRMQLTPLNKEAVEMLLWNDVLGVQITPLAQ